MFELWVDKTKVLGNLSITQAIASFLHMAFVFDLHYPKVCHPTHPPLFSVIVIVKGMPDPRRYLAEEVCQVWRPLRYLKDKEQERPQFFLWIKL